MRELTEDEMSGFLAHIEQLAEDAGWELDDDDRQELFQQSQERGFSPQATVAAFEDWSGEDDYDDDDYDYEEVEEPADEIDPTLIRHLNDDLERLSGEEGRRLTSRETEIIARGALHQAERYDQINAREALDDHYRANPNETRIDMSTEKGRGEFYTQRLSEMDKPAEVPDHLDLDNTEDRHAFLKARMQGAEFEDA